jgi:hypothetical protein
MTGYEIVFDIANQGYKPQWLPLAAGVFVALVCVHVFRTARDKVTRILTAVLVCLAVAGTVAELWRHHREYESLRQVVLEGRYTVLEGRVTDFQRDPWGGNVPQIFSVAGHRFEVHGPRMTASFHQTVSQGGPDLTGKCVRIGFTTNDTFVPPTDMIVWLGIRRSGCADEVDATSAVDGDSVTHTQFTISPA